MTQRSTLHRTEPSHRAIYATCGAHSLYEYLRRPGDPEFSALAERQQLAFVSAFMIGAASVDLRRVLVGEEQ